MDKTLKEKLINIIFYEINKIIKNYSNEKPYSNCRIKEGYNDYLRISLKKERIDYYKFNFRWDREPDLKLDFKELKKIKREDFIKEIVPEIKSKFEELFFRYEVSSIFRYKFLLVLEFEEENDLLEDRTYKKELYFESKKRKEELKNKMNEYIKEVIFEEKKAMKDDRECYIFCHNLLDFNLMKYSEKSLIELVEKILQVMKSSKNRKLEKEFKNSLSSKLEDWVTDIFLKLEPEKILEEQIDLYVYSALFKAKYIRYDYSLYFASKDLKNAVKIFKSKKAKKYLEEGTGILADELIYYKDENLECKANDILTVVNIKIKNENMNSYEKALEFIINLLNNGFPPSYAIKFSSKIERKYLKIRGLAKSSTHRFFRRILDFPELYDKLENYIRIGIEKNDWYQDVEEGEKSCMLGSYGLFGLGLYDEKYFPLVKEYFKKVDAEHQIVHQYFIEDFINKYGITEKSIPIILIGLLSGQFDKVFKNLEKLMKNEENKKLLIKEVEKFEDYEKEIILYSIWGDKWENFYTQNLAIL